MNYLKKYIKNYWKPFCLAIACLTAEAACDLLQPTIMAKIIDVGVKEKQMDYIISMGTKMLMVTGLGALAAVSRNIISSNVSQKFGADLREDLFKKIQKLSVENIDKFGTASLVTRLTNDVTQVQNFVNGLMRIFVKAPLLCIGSIIMAIRLNLSMSMVFLIVVPIISLLIYMNMNISYPFFTKTQKAIDKINSTMREYLSGVRVVKAFNRFKYEEERFEKSNEELKDVSISALRVNAFFSPNVTLTINLGIATILWIGGNKVNSGNMQVGQIIAFTNYMTQILFSLMMISHVLTMFVKARASAERIGEVLNQEDNIKVIEKPIDTFDIKGRIDFEDVYFSYAGASGEPVLKNVNFTCRSGETVGIIGSTGSGKSTLVNLICRFYDVTNGCIKVNNVNIKDMDIKELRNKIAVVHQTIVLFSGTIKDNIKWGKEDASMDEIEEVSKIAEAHEFISSLPKGYDTFLGQGGVNLSGGQKQRVSIARALIKEPEILILDDCTSAVDVTTEMKIKKALKEYSKDLTCIVIAQRITSVMDADKIIVLDNGKIAGIGKHEELLKECEVYKDIFRSQVGSEVI